MNGYVTNIEKSTLENETFRTVLYTAKNSQLVVMSLLPLEDIGAEAHHLDQFIRVEAGQGKAVLNGNEYDIGPGHVVVVPAGVMHNIINTSPDSEMKLYTLYSPPNHKDGTVHKTKADAERDEGEHWSGEMTEASS